MTKLYRAHRFNDKVPPTGTFENPYLLTPRRPLTTPLWLHNAADQWFHDTFQVSFRSRALFGTGSLEQAKKYLRTGAVMLSFWPISPFKICFSPYVEDLFGHFFTGEPPPPDAVAEFLNSCGYRPYENNGMQEAIASNCEVMVFANTFGYELLDIPA